MVSRIIEGMVDFFTGPAPPNDHQLTAAEKSNSTDLFTCVDCNDTYIQNDMDACPKCGETVEPTPSFAELDIGPPGKS